MTIQEHGGEKIRMSERVLSSGGSEAASSWRGRDVGRRAPGAQVSLPQHVTPQEVLWAGCVAFVLKNAWDLMDIEKGYLSCCRQS